MADFAAILKKTLDKMGETTPEIRVKVYDRARQTVQRQIDAMATRPPQAAIDRQFEKLEAAIAGIEADHAVAVAEPEPEADTEPVPPVEEVAIEPVEETAKAEAQPADDVADVEVEPAEEAAEAEPAEETPEVDVEPAEDAPAEAVDEDDVSVAEDVTDVDEAPEDAEAIPAEDDAATAEEVVPDAEEPVSSSDTDVDLSEEASVAAADDDDIADWAEEAIDADDGLPPADALVEFLNEQKEQLTPVPGIEPDEAERAVEALFDDIGDENRDGRTMPPEIGDAPPGVDGMPMVDERGRGRAGLWITLLLLVGVLAGGGYAAYAYQGPLRTFLADYGITVPEFWPAGDETAPDEDAVPVRTVETQPAPAPEETPAEEPEEAPETETVDMGGEEEAAPKFTQRLTPDGREVDEGPATAPGGPGEGSTVAGQSAAAEAPAPDTEAGAEEPAGEDAPVAVGQRTIFYEERTGTQPGTALQGATVWSVVQESPGGDLPLEPAIRAESSVPELGLELEMTLRRNGDTTFPASHIVELFFTVPETFEGRGIADVQRITFKDTEQDPGSALIAVPAPIDTNIFLVALTDAQTATETNIALMRSQGWLDIPMQYVSGRRALITMEKGVAGNRVFNEVFEAWEAAPLNVEEPAEATEAQ